jgi:hypothetical protein
MKALRITIFLLISIVIACCIMQTTMVSCSANKSKTPDSGDADTGDGATFMERAGGQADQDGWHQVSETVVTQVEDNYKQYGIQVDKIERSISGEPGTRLTLSHRAGLSREKELMDGLYMLYETFPDQRSYHVEIAGVDGAAVDADWPSLEAMAQAGYTLDSPEALAAQLWGTVAKSVAEVPPSGEVVSAQTDGQ